MSMTWQRIAARDPYLAGHIAARECVWWEGETVATAADSVGLTGDQRAVFLASWWESLVELRQEERAAKQQELNRLLDACADGYDPAARTKWSGILS